MPQAARPDPRVLGRSVLFAGLPDHDLAAVADSSRLEHRAAGEAVFRRGDPGDACYLVQEGRVRVVLPADAGTATALDVLGPGDFFGELALIDGAPRSADVVADVPTWLAVLPRDPFLRVVGAHPRVADRMVTVLRQRLQRHQLLVGETGHPDVPARLTKAVSDLAAMEQRSRPVIEILPVFLRDGHPWWLHPASGEALRCPTAGAAHPGELVDTHLARLGLDCDVAHSTSWRYDGGTLLLTYLAIVSAPGDEVDLHQAQVARVDLARGTAKAAPGAILVDQVLEHALRHLRWLLGNDPAIKAEAGADWLAATEGYQPEPFRSLDPLAA